MRIRKTGWLIGAVVFAGLLAGLVYVAGSGGRAPASGVGANVRPDPRGTKFNLRELSPELLVLFEGLPEGDRSSIASLPRAETRAFMIQVQSVSRRLTAGRTDVDLGLFVDELKEPRWKRARGESGAQADTDWQWDFTDASGREWSSLMILAHARIVGAAVPEPAAIEARAIEVLRASKDDIERAHAIMLLWVFRHYGPERGLSRAGVAALDEAMKGDAMQPHLARRFLKGMGVPAERLVADFGSNSNEAPR